MTLRLGNFHYRVERAPHPAAAITLLLLHGTGGDESDLLPIGEQLAAVLPHRAHLLSPRGRVSGVMTKVESSAHAERLQSSSAKLAASRRTLMDKTFASGL